MSRRTRKNRRSRALETRSTTGSFPYRRRLRFEPLEDRRLLSAASGDEALQLFSTSTALFVENQGQWQDETVRYAFNGPGVNIAFTDEGLKFLLTQREEVAQPALGEADSPTVPGEENFVTQTAQFSVSFDGANVATPVGLNEAETRFNYFVGDQANWHANVPGFATVAYENLYDGIDLHTFGRRDSLKYEFYVAPGADWRQIQVSYDGVQGLWIDATGALHVQTELGELIDDAPYIYQVIDGKEVEVAGAFQLVDGDTYAFDLTGSYNPHLQLVIDPNLAWSTYLGGSSSDRGYGVAVDASGAVVVTGNTVSSGWVSGGFDTSYNGGNYDAFVAKLSSSGGHLWSTYLGGSSSERGRGVAVDAAGAVVVTGFTDSSGWVSGGFDTSYNGGNYDAFVVKLSSSGGHLWSTYLGGSSFDYGNGVAVDASGAVVVTGYTDSSGWVSGGFDTSYGGGGDAFVAKLSSSGGHLWSTYLGDTGHGVAVDASGAVVVTGITQSTDWVSGGFDTSYGGGYDAFVAKLSSSGGHLWSTYLGGSSFDRGDGVAVDAAGAVVVTGITQSTDWVSGGFDTSYGGGVDAFVAKLSSSGGHLWSTYLGGSSSDEDRGVAVDAAGAVVVTGITQSTDWVSGGFDTSYGGGYDAFVVKLSSSGGHLWSTYLGGSSFDYGNGVAVDASGAVVVTGYTNSSGWVSGGFDTSLSGSDDAFVARIEDAGVGTVSSLIWRDGPSSTDSIIAYANVGETVYAHVEAPGYEGSSVPIEIYEYDGGVVADQLIASLLVPIGQDGTGSIAWQTSWQTGDDAAPISSYFILYDSPGGTDVASALLQSQIPPVVNPGVTIITHGWQLFGTFPGNWPVAMGLAILDRADGSQTAQPRGSIFKHDPGTGLWMPLTDDWNNTNSDADQVVLLYDWAVESDDAEAGWLEAAADNLFASLLQINTNLSGDFAGQSFFDIALNANDLDFHFIGHSRGAVVNSLVTARFDEHFHGLMIDQVTSLDPHPWSLDYPGNSNPEADPGYNPVTPSTGSFLATYDNVRFADNYYHPLSDNEYESFVALPPDFDLGDFGGVEARGAFNQVIPNEVLAGVGSVSEHSDVHSWYYGTITGPLAADSAQLPGYSGPKRNYDGDTDIPADWYGTSGIPLRNWTGFAFSRIGYQYSSLFLPVAPEVMDIVGERIDAGDTTTVFNGNFEIGNTTQDRIPGWERHGGGVDSDLTDDGRLRLGKFGPISLTSITHNWLYIPPTAAGLGFTYAVGESPRTGFLQVLLEKFTSGGLKIEQVIDTIGLGSVPTSTEFPRFIELDANYLGSTSYLKFELVSGSPGTEVFLDNVNFSAAPPDGDLDGVSNDIESLAPNAGDGNSDGVPDVQQAHVSSIVSTGAGSYLTLTAPQDLVLLDVSSKWNPEPFTAPPGRSFAEAFLDFELTGLAPGTAKSVELILHSGRTPLGYYKFGPTPDNPSAHWYEFLFDGTTGAEISENHVVLHFVDGLRGDDDLTANGVIVDIGGPAFAGVPGDYDRSGETNELDQLVWRASFGATVGAGQGADGNGDGVVDAADYVVWRKNVGATLLPPQSSGAGSGEQVASVELGVGSGEQVASVELGVGSGEFVESLAPSIQSAALTMGAALREVAPQDEAIVFAAPTHTPADPADFDIRLASKRTVRPPALTRTTSIVAARQDDALALWLAARNAGRPTGDDDTIDSESQTSPADDHENEVGFDALDSAFSSLAV